MSTKEISEQPSSLMNFRKLLFILICPVFLFMGERTVAQRILGAVSAGINLAQVDGDEVYGFKKVGLNFGPSVIIPFGKTKKWSVTLELLFSQIGSNQKSEYPARTDSIKNDTGFYDGYRLNLTYVQVPVMVHFTDKRFIAAGVGFLYGQLVGVSEYEDYNDYRGFIKSETNLQGPYTRSDFQALADVRIRLYRGLWFNVRYSYSMFPIRTREYKNHFYGDTWTRKQYNNVIALRLVYIFNDILPEKKPKEFSK